MQGVRQMNLSLYSQEEEINQVALWVGSKGISQDEHNKVQEDLSFHKLNTVKERSRYCGNKEKSGGGAEEQRKLIPTFLDNQHLSLDNNLCQEATSMHV